ncbi:MAG: hypothetical protein U0353_05885 [Sandaracinus sp.]
MSEPSEHGGRTDGRRLARRHGASSRERERAQARGERGCAITSERELAPSVV